MEINMIKYGQEPKILKEYNNIDTDEMMLYQYLPIFIRGVGSFVPRQLERFGEIISDASVDYFSNFDECKYIYITAKTMWVNAANPGNRPGWHADGYGSNGDINYIWSDSSPTEFAIQAFKDIPLDDFESIKEFERQVKPECIRTYPNKTLLRLDESVVHRVGKVEEGVRTFIKLSFSNHKFNLKGNSRNYDLDYDWKMFDRAETRNIDNKDYVDENTKVWKPLLQDHSNGEYYQSTNKLDWIKSDRKPRIGHYHDTYVLDWHC
jgi:hypothetical protein